MDAFIIIPVVLVYGEAMFADYWNNRSKCLLGMDCVTGALCATFVVCEADVTVILIL